MTFKIKAIGTLEGTDPTPQDEARAWAEADSIVVGHQQPNRRPLYIFDLDGTLALANHRQHLLAWSDNPDRWRAFYAACGDDEPNWPVIHLMLDLAAFCDVWIWSGRSDEVKEQTFGWLQSWTGFIPEVLDHRLRMRPAGDHRADQILKKEWLDAMSDEDRARLVGVFEDRDRVVAMWRQNGVAAFQVAPGAF